MRTITEIYNETISLRSEFKSITADGSPYSLINNLAAKVEVKNILMECGESPEFLRGVLVSIADLCTNIATLGKINQEEIIIKLITLYTEIFCELIDSDLAKAIMEKERV